MDHNGFERQTRHFSATININWTNPAWVGYFSPHLEKIKQLLICSKHQNTWEDTGNGFFFFNCIEECCVVIENNIDKKLANRISYQIWYKGCLKGKFGRGSKSAKGGPYPLTDLDRGGRIKLFEVLPAIQRNPWVQVNFVSFRSFWPRYGKNITAIGMF